MRRAAETHRRRATAPHGAAPAAARAERPPARSPQPAEPPRTSLLQSEAPRRHLAFPSPLTPAPVHPAQPPSPCSVDDVPLFHGRTPVRIYGDFMESFRSRFRPWLGSTITAVSVSLGPAGELRYPAYPAVRTHTRRAAHRWGARPLDSIT